MTSTSVLSRAEAIGAGRRVVHRTRGRSHGPITRLMSPGDLGHVVKPFVFLDHVDFNRAPFGGMALHPHSGIATVTYLFEGSVQYEDTGGQQGVLRAGGLEWFKAGHGAWHGGAPDGDAMARGFQLWVALPADHELAPVESLYREPESLVAEGPVQILLGDEDTAAIRPPAPVTYLAVRLKAGEVWTLTPKAGQTVGWCAVSRGRVRTPEVIEGGELAVFEPGSGEIRFEAETDADLVVGAAVPHPHDLVMGYYSVHTDAAALEAGERRIVEVREQLRAAGRL